MEMRPKLLLVTIRFLLTPM